MALFAAIGPALSAAGSGGVSSFLGSGLGSAALGAASSMLNFSGNKRQIRHQLAANKEMADYQMQQNIALWNMQNAYNTPIAQMHRYQEAGLNPNLVATQGNSGNAGSISPYEAPKVDRAEVKFQNFLDSLMKASSIKNMEKQNDKIGKEIDALEINNQRAAGEYNEWLATSGHRETLRNNEIEMKATELALSKVKYDSDVLHINQAAQQFEDYKKMFKLQLESQEIDNRIKKATEDSVINKALSESTIASNQAEASKYLSDKARADINNAWLTAEGIKLSNEGKKISNKTAEYNQDITRYQRDNAAYQDFLRVKHLKETEDSFIYNLIRDQKNDQFNHRMQLYKQVSQLAGAAGLMFL